MDSNLKLSKDGGPLLDDPILYRRLIGRLLYLTITRSDLTYSIHLLCQYMATLHLPHLQAAYKVLKYVKNSPAQGLFFAACSSYHLTTYCDSDWLLALIQEDSPLVIVFFFVNLSFLGNLKSKPPFLEALLKLNIDQWQLPYVKLYGSNIFLLISALCTPNLLLYIATANLPCTLQLISFFTNVQNILN